MDQIAPANAARGPSLCCACTGLILTSAVWSRQASYSKNGPEIVIGARDDEDDSAHVGCREAGGKSAGIATFLHRAAAYHPGLSRASSLQDASSMAAGPQNEVILAQTALRNAIALCKRHVRDSTPEVIALQLASLARMTNATTPVRL